MTYKIDVLIVSMSLATASVGYYSVASAAGGSVVPLGQAYGMLLFSDNQWSRRATIRRAGVALAGTALIAVPAAIAVPWVVRTIYGPSFHNAERAAQVLILAAIPQAADYLLIHAHLLTRRLRRLYYVQLVTAAFTVIGLLVVLGDDHLIAIAAISPISYALSAALLALNLRDREQKGTDCGSADTKSCYV